MMNMTLSLPTQRFYRIGVSMFFFIQGLSFGSWASRIPDIKSALHLSDGAFGSTLLGLPMGQMSAMALSGYLVSKYGSRTTLTIGALLYPAILILIGLVTQGWQLFAILYLFGVCSNLCNISVNTQGVGVERLYRRSIMASFHGVWSTAGFVGGAIGSIMVSNNVIPVKHFIIIYGVVLVLILIARPIILPRDENKAVGKRKIFVRPDKSILILGLITFACMICEGTMFEWSGIYFQNVVEAPKNLIRLGFIAFMSTMASGRFAADWLVTRYGIHRIIKLSGIIIFSGMMLAVAFPHIITSTIGFSLVGFGVSSVVPMMYSLAGKSKTMLAGVALASVSSIGFFGFLFGPPIIGFIAQASNLRFSFALIAFLGLGTTLLSGRLNKE